MGTECIIAVIIVVILTLIADGGVAKDKKEGQPMGEKGCRNTMNILIPATIAALIILFFVIGGPIVGIGKGGM